jgi:glycosyltransferase involved in cell wall biosynthesis
MDKKQNDISLLMVSIIVPCLNEEEWISVCLDSIIANDYPKEYLEVLVVDGMSKDKTREIVAGYTVKHSYIRLFDNPKVTTPAAMNMGITHAKGDVIIKMDAHTKYSTDYISKCVRHLQESGADNVGGILESVASANTLEAKAIAICLSHVFGAGGSTFRIGAAEPMEVDTVAFGCWKREVFEKIGVFNEQMAQIEDLEFNYRLRAAGGTIMLFPDIRAQYYPSSATLPDFFMHNYTDGIWATYPLKYGFKVSLRHLIPLLFVVTIFVSIWLYIWVSLLFSLQVAAAEKNWRFLFIMPLAFGARHIAYGIGSLVGLFKILQENGGEKNKGN